MPPSDFRMRPVAFSFLLILLGCGLGDDSKVRMQTNSQSGRTEWIVDRGVHHAALSLDSLPSSPAIRVRFWELDTDHQQPPIEVTGKLLNAGLRAIILDKGPQTYYGFWVEGYSGFWYPVAHASLYSTAWQAEVRKKNGNLNRAALQMVEEVAPYKDWAQAWAENGYALKIQSLEKVQLCSHPDDHPNEKSLCGAMVAFKATRL